MSYVAIYARNKRSEMCQSKKGFFFVRVERFYEGLRSWGRWFPVVNIERNNQGHVVAKISDKDIFVYTVIEEKTVSFRFPNTGIVKSIDSKT